MRDRGSNPRDSQRRRVYAAEGDVFPWSSAEPQPLEQCAARVQAILTSAAVAERFPGLPTWMPTVESVRGHTSHGGCSLISLSPFARSPAGHYILVHEMAHLIIERHLGIGRVAWHGWEWCDAYLWLLERFVGQGAADALRGAFKRRRVRYRRPPQISPERRAALREAARAWGARRRAEAAQADAPAGQDSSRGAAKP